MTKTSGERGFTLLELAIVAVVIGVLVGAIFSGMHLLRMAQFRQIAKDQETFVAAALNFKDKYGYLPGDFPSATRFWGRADGGADTTQNCAQPAINSMKGPPTCNGNGDRKINDDDSPNVHEPYRFWEHLAAAGYLPGNFTGVPGPLNDDHSVANVNVPAASFDGSGWYIHYLDFFGWNGCLWSVGNRFDGCYGNFLQVGRLKHDDGPWYPLFTGPEAQGYDAKYDDGKPGTGKIVAVSPEECTDAADSSDLTADYLPNDEEPICSLQFLNLF
jgi:prepilin-type N-terminal cleavage/methylation domain-containing protein